MKLTFYGHSAFGIETSSGVKILIDPFFSGNPFAQVGPESIDADVILVTHGHGDHIGDTESIAKRCNSLIIAVYEIAEYFEAKGLRSHGMHIGGAYNFEFGRVKLTQALHGSSYNGVYMGAPAGILLTVDNKTVYHCGDTGLFMDMQLIGKMNNVDVMLVPIGGNYTMDTEDAVCAVEFVKPKVAVPMHYNTFPVINTDVNRFITGVEKLGIQAIILESGQNLS